MVWISNPVSGGQCHRTHLTILKRFSLYVHKSGLKPNSFRFIFKSASQVVMYPIYFLHIEGLILSIHLSAELNGEHNLLWLHSLGISTDRVVNPVFARWCSILTQPRSCQKAESNKHKTLIQCRINACPASAPLAQHWNNTGQYSVFDTDIGHVGRPTLLAK